ncbi:MAG: protease modulator HflK [Victivallaceae bacterium]|nr:protease modulator HflK [Victivallaceae bacterium]
MDNMEKGYQQAAERAQTMGRLALLSTAAAAVFAIAALAMGTIWDTVAGSDVFSLGFPVYIVVVIFSLAAFINAVLCAAANREEIDKIELEKRKSSHHAFSVDEDVRFTAGRAFANYKKYAPFVVAVLMVCLMGALLSGYAAYWGHLNRIKAEPENPIRALVVSVLMMTISGFIGAFYIGQARSAAFRWLRVVGAWFMVGFLIMLAASIELCLVRFNITSSGYYFAWGGWTLLMVLTAEIIINFIVDFYRPRTGDDVRPLYESSLLSLFTEPGGVMRNIANTLDYQFGFKVSGTYIYGFVEKALFPALVVWLIVLWLFTGIDQIGPSQVGLRLRCGRLVSSEPMTPGIYCKLPWPFEEIRRYSCTEVRELMVGSDYDRRRSAAAEGGENADFKAKIAHIALWTQNKDNSGDSYMVAVRDVGSVKDSSGLPVNLAFLNASVPVQYHIRQSELLQYAFHSRDPEALLRLAAESVVSEYLASIPLMDTMATGRQKVTTELKQRIQRAADDLQLGVEIDNVGLIDVYPAPETIESYQNVISAQEDMRTTILSAMVEQQRLLPASESMAYATTAMAEAYSASQKVVASADAERFTRQLEAYSALPELFTLRSYLEVLVNETWNVRKFIVSESLKDEVFEMNFEENPAFDFGNVELGK